MAKYDLPNGQTLNIPDDLPYEAREEVAGLVKKQFGIDINQTNVLGQAKEFFKGIPRGIGTFATDVPIGVASLFDIGNDSPLTQELLEYKRKLREDHFLSADPAYRDTWWTKAGEGLGSFVPFLGAGALGRAAVTRGVGAKLPTLAQPTFTLPAALAVPSGISQQADRIQMAREMGEEVGPVAETFAEMLGGVIGLSELAPVYNLFKRVPKNVLINPTTRDLIQKRLRSAAITGGAEALQEATASIMQGLVARGLYSDELPIADSLFDELTIGGFVGGISDLVINSMAGYRGIGRHRLKDREGRARKNIVDLEADGKYERAQEQGMVEEFQDIPPVTKPEIPLPPIVEEGPLLEVIENPNATFSVIDLNATETPVLKIFDGEADALSFKNKEQTNYDRRKLKVILDNATYSLGMPDSSTALVIGSTILDPNISEINLQSIISFDKKLSEDQRKRFNKERAQVFGPNPYRQMLANREANLKEVGKYIKSKGLVLKSSYTMPEAKKILSPTDYNNLLIDTASVVFAESEKAGEPSITADKDRPNVNLKYIRSIAKSKNIEIDFKDPAVRYAAQQWTGTADMSRTRNRGVKELFLARLHSLPKFNNITKFPDFRPRVYTAQDVANFVASKGSQNAEFTVDELLKEGVTSKNKAATEQFIGDLVNSGRAERIKGTRRYQIRENHEFDIARRAEGFNETPREFGERLRREGKLPEETILQLVEAETVKQQKVLPPEEIEPKLFNFEEAVEMGRTNKFAQELRKILDKAGLRETGVIVSNDILSTTTLAQTQEGKILYDPRATRATAAEGAVEGEYDRNTDIIFLSLNAVNPDGTASDIEIQQRLNSVMAHELIHALRAKDLINEREYQYLRKEVRRRKVPEAYDPKFKGRSFYQRSREVNKATADEFLARGATEQRIEEFYVEEAIAELYRSRDFKPDLPPKTKGIFGKVVNFFKSMGQAMRTSGYKRASDVFAEISSGRVGARTRGEIRTLRELDRLRPEAVEAPIAEEVEETFEDIATPAPTETTTGVVEGVEPTTTFGEVEADTDPITGIIVTPSGVSRPGGALYDVRKLTAEEKEADKQLLLKELSNKDSLGVLDWLAKNSPSNDYRVIAERLLTQQKKLKRVAKMGFDFRFITQPTDRHPADKGQRWGSWMGVSTYPNRSANKNDFIVYINNQPRAGTANGVDFNTILHELVHQTTQAATSWGRGKITREAVDNLENIRRKLRAEIQTRGGNVDFYVKYGTKNIQELLAVGFTDREFQKFMEEIKYTPQGKQSIWDKFVESIRKLLQIPAKQGTVFSAFLKEGGRITDLSIKEIEAIESRAIVGKTFEGALPAEGVAPPTFSREPGPFANLSLDYRSNDNELTTQFLEIMGYESQDVMPVRPTEMDREYTYEITGDAVIAYTPAEGWTGVNAKISQKSFKNPTYGQLLKWSDPTVFGKPAKPPPTFSRGKRLVGTENTTENIQLREATEKAEEVVKQAPRGEVPLYNLNASDVALKAAIDFNEDATAKPPPLDIPNWSRGEVPSELAESVKNTGYAPPTASFGARLIDIASNPIENVRKAFKDTRQNYIDKLDKTQKKIVQGSEENENVRLANNSADTATMAALRMADKARGIFQGLLMRGYASDVIEGSAALTNVKPLKISTRFNPFIEGNEGYGGLMQITAPLYADPTVDLEAVFALYGKLKRVKSMNEQGREILTPVTPKDLEQLELIESNYKSVVEVYNNYQLWNNQLINFAEAKGLLNKEQADLWREHSSYYPFYRDMVDEEGITAPTIGGGSLPNNPLNIKIKGSEREITVPPIEAIARNSLSILTASMKNDGTSKLLRDLESMGEARAVTPKQSTNLNTIFVFEDGIKQHYQVDDIELFHGIQAIGGVKTDFITKFLALPSAFLRDTVTRDPGFIVVNLLRDTLSAAVTAGAPLGGEGFTPIIDTMKNMFADMESLEKFGVIGGYDFSNDEGSVVDLMNRARRKQGLTPDNGMNPKDAFFYVWDGLGALTTKSDGATRLAVYNAVYNKMKNEGYTEAQAQSEAAFQGLEIINFGRRGLSPMFRVITSAIPFLNARVQGLDVLYRSATGQYSASEKLQEGETLKDVQSKITRKFLLRGGMLMGLTAIYYLLVSDTDEYKAVKREVRDDNWIIPNGTGFPFKIPIPFEVGMLFKALPERLIDEFVGRQVEKAPGKSIWRQLGTSANVPFITGDIGIQAVKPLFEYFTNRNTFTKTDIVPYYQTKLLPAYQARKGTNEVARVLGEAFNISPLKIEHVLRGYTGTLGGYVLDIADVVARSMTGTPIIPPNLNDVPLLKRLFVDIDKSGGLQQQFYELRFEVDRATQTMNSLRKQGRMDELDAYRSNTKGVMQVKGQVRALERYMDNWRKKRDRLLQRNDISASVKSDMLRAMELERDRRLAFVPVMRQRANVPMTALFN